MVYTHLIRLEMVDLSCLDWRNLTGMVIVHVSSWCALGLMPIRLSDLVNHCDDRGQSSVPNVFREGRRGCYFRTRIHPNRHTEKIFGYCVLNTAWKILPNIFCVFVHFYEQAFILFKKLIYIRNFQKPYIYVNVPNTRFIEDKKNTHTHNFERRIWNHQPENCTYILNVMRYPEIIRFYLFLFCFVYI